MKPKSGLNTIMTMDKELDTEEQDEQSIKVVKLRFTRKQYQAFRDACKIFEVVSSDPGFPDFVKSALGADIKVQTITKQLVQPILEAPIRIPIKIPRVTKEGEQKKESYFTAPTEVTDKCLRLYERVKDEVELRHDVLGGTTCVTDVRVMMSRYISMENLRTDDGIVLDDFIKELAPESIHANSEYIHKIDGQHVIPKNNRKVMTGIVNEITFGQ